VKPEEKDSSSICLSPPLISVIRASKLKEMSKTPGKREREREKERERGKEIEKERERERERER
jgi:hypothetical protein